MQGRSTFTCSEIAELRRLIREKQTADRDRQKSLRARMRRMGFYITDVASDYSGFVVSDLDDLIARGVLEIVAGDPGHDGTRAQATRRSTSTSARPAANVGQRPRLRRSSHEESTESAEIERYVPEALRTLDARQAEPIARAAARVPRKPGLYTIHGSATAWRELGLGKPRDERPLYVGKAEESLAGRDIDTHFGNGRTGQSTVRRSFAALLHDTLGLRGMPRNPARPGYFTNYGLSPEHDELLTRWMREHLRLAVWPKPEECKVALLTIERRLLATLQPPLNLKDVATPWSAKLSAARRVLADEARDWRL